MGRKERRAASRYAESAKRRDARSSDREARRLREMQDRNKVWIAVFWIGLALAVGGLVMFFLA